MFSSPFRGISSNVIIPVVGVSKPFIHLSNVLLPEPDGPIITTTSPSLTFNDISLRTEVFSNDLLI